MEIHAPASAIAQDIECLVDELYGVWLSLQTQCTRAEMARILTVLAPVEEFEDAEPTIRTILQNGAFLGKFSEPLPENWEAYVDDGTQPPREEREMTPKDAAGTSPAALHREAMTKADEALIARGAGDETAARSLFAESFHLEREALSLVPKGSMNYFALARSAAVLALDAGLPHDAEALATSALSETPPAWAVKDLRDVLKAAREAS